MYAHKLAPSNVFISCNRRSASHRLFEVFSRREMSLVCRRFDVADMPRSNNRSPHDTGPIRGSWNRQHKHLSAFNYKPFSSLSSLTNLKSDHISCDTLIVGGGPVGCSTAYHLARQRGNQGQGIVVVEKDFSYAQSSATLSAGGLRQQFSLKENVQMSLYGLEFLQQAPQQLGVDVQFQPHGYLFLASTPEGRMQMESNHQVQRDAGCHDTIRLLERNQLQQRFPWLHTDDVFLGSFGQQGEGWFDPWALLQGFKQKCIDMGVQFVSGYPVGSQRQDSSCGRVLSVDVQQTSRQKDSHNSNAIVTFSVNKVVNAAGAHCQPLLQLLAQRPLQYPLPVEPRKRCVFFFHCPTAHDLVVPLTICPGSGVYVRSEGSSGSGRFLCGVSPRPQDDRALQPGERLDVTEQDCCLLFDETIWPALYKRVPEHFGNIKVLSSWAGLYEYNAVDQNAIIDFHPEVPNVVLVNGFSGHGLQHSPASGRAAAELIDHGRFQTLNLDIFRFERLFPGGTPIFESGIV